MMHTINVHLTDNKDIGRIAVRNLDTFVTLDLGPDVSVFINSTEMVDRLEMALAEARIMLLEMKR